MNKLKLKILTIAIQLFGGKMLKQVQAYLAGKKTYIVCVAAILGALAGYAEGSLSLGQFIEAITVALGGITLKAGITRDIKNGNGK